MKKQEIKKDPIRDRIISIAQYISDNIRYIWIGVGCIILFIFIITISSNQHKTKLSESNLEIGLIQNKVINNQEEDDSLLLLEYQKIFNNPKSEDSYNQAFIYILSDAIKDNDKDKINILLDDNNFSSTDDMLSAFICKVTADYSDDVNVAIAYYRKAMIRVPNYDLKVAYGIDLIDLYIEQSNYTEAENTLEFIKDLIDNLDNLPSSAKNDLDFIEYKIKQLIN